MTDPPLRTLQVSPAAADGITRVIRLALNPGEAAAAIGVSRDFFDEHVLPELRVVRRGRKVIVSIAELERWLADSAALTVGASR